MADSSIIRCLSCGANNRVGAVASGTPRCAKCHEALPWLVNATSESFDAEVASSVPVVVDFWAEWCGPCRAIAPALQSLAGKHASRLKVVKVDCDAHGDLAQRYQAQSIPLLVLFKDGKEVDRQVGAVPERALEAWLQPHLATAKA